jgi:L-glyceraldehyde 3-phosphate reductase
MSQVSPERVEAARHLNEIAGRRGESLAGMAINWLLADRRVISVIVGASSVEQLKANIGPLNQKGFTSEELDCISRIASQSGVQF